MTDEDLKKFYEKNKDKIDRIMEMKQEEEAEAKEHFRRDYRRTIDALDELRDALSDLAGQPEDFDRRYDDYRERGSHAYHRVHDDAKRYKYRAEEEINDKLSFLSDPDLQKHVIGAGMEMIAAFGALIKSGPFPDAVKRAADTGNITRNEEFCNNNPDCKVRAKAVKKAPETEEPNARAVKIEVKKTPKGGKP